MKLTIVASMAILGMISGVLFGLNNNINESDRTQITQTTVVSPPVISDNVIIIPETTSIITSYEYIPENNGTSARSFDDLIGFYEFGARNNALVVFTMKLRKDYPDRFTPENIEESFRYIDSKFPKTGWSPIMYNTFTW